MSLKGAMSTRPCTFCLLMIVVCHMCCPSRPAEKQDRVLVNFGPSHPDREKVRHFRMLEQHTIHTHIHTKYHVQSLLP
jgi:hypothetical protein